LEHYFLSVSSSFLCWFLSFENIVKAGAHFSKNNFSDETKYPWGEKRFHNNVLMN
jgi:hypothetical protein